MIHFYVDIEGTLIDNLFDANYLHHNCANIKNYIHKHDGHPYKVDFFTWGWKTEKEIEKGLVHNLFNRLEILPENRGRVIVKEESVEKFLKMVELPYEPEMLLAYGGFADCGFTKPHVWCMTRDEGDIGVLIDDTVTETDSALSNIGEIYINPSRMLVGIFINEEESWMLCTPDNQHVGKVVGYPMLNDVQIQIMCQELKGYYLVTKTGKRLDIDDLGNVWAKDGHGHDFILNKAPGTKAQMMPYFNNKLIQLQPPLAYTDNQ